MGKLGEQRARHRFHGTRMSKNVLTRATSTRCQAGIVVVTCECLDVIVCHRRCKSEELDSCDTGARRCGSLITARGAGTDGACRRDNVTHVVCWRAKRRLPLRKIGRRRRTKLAGSSKVSSQKPSTKSSLAAGLSRIVRGVARCRWSGVRKPSLPRF